MADDQAPQDWLGGKTPAGSSRRRRRWAAAGLVAAGLVAGGVMAGTLGASAASSTSPAATYGVEGSATGTEAEHAGDHGPGDGHGHGLDLSGTVTAVGTSTVTIKTASGTKTYAVSSSSDIDKNGEAKLSSLVVGDAVTFSTTTSGSTVTIDKLHAGNEALDRPQKGGTPG